jgi:hypothetical protein
MHSEHPQRQPTQEPARADPASANAAWGPPNSSPFSIHGYTCAALPAGTHTHTSPRPRTLPVPLTLQASVYNELVGATTCWETVSVVGALGNATWGPGTPHPPELFHGDYHSPLRLTPVFRHDQRARGLRWAVAPPPPPATAPLLVIVYCTEEEERVLAAAGNEPCAP